MKLRPAAGALRPWIVATALSLFLAGSTNAAGPAHNTVIVLIDQSGSMRVADPNCLRADALNLLLALLPRGDRLHIATFGSTVVPLLQGALVGDQVNPVRTPTQACAAGDADTDIAAALAEAVAIISGMSSADRAGFPPAIVLLTDGRHDPPPGRAAPLDDVRARVREANVPVIALGLGSGVDQRLLSELGELSGGTSQTATSAADLSFEFLRAARLLGRRWLVLDTVASDAMPVSVVLPPWATEWRVVVLASGLSPSATRVNGHLPRTATGSYAVFEGQGERGLEVTVPRGRILVDVTGDLVLQPRVPTTVAEGIPFPCAFGLGPGAGGALGSPQFLRQASALLSLTRRSESKAIASFSLYDDGAHGDDGPLDGVFGAHCLVGSAGAYEWTASVQGVSLDAPRATGQLRVLASPVTAEPPGYFVRALAVSLGRPIELRLTNVTDVLLSVGNAAGGEVILPPGGQGVLPFSLPAEPYSSTVREAKLEIRGSMLRPAVMVDLPPRLLIPGIIVIGLALISMANYLPRRSVAGAVLSVRTTTGTPRSGDVFAATTSLPTAGRPTFPPIVPSPFNDPGGFRARSGIWRRGVVYTPAPWVQPRFPGRVRRVGAGYVLGRVATWTCSSGSVVVTYTLTSR